MERGFGSGQGVYHQSGFSQRGSARQRSHQPQNWRERNSETSPHTNNLPIRQNYVHHPQSQRDGHSVVRQYQDQAQNGSDRRSETSSFGNYLPPHQRYAHQPQHQRQNWRDGHDVERQHDHQPQQNWQYRRSEAFRSSNNFPARRDNMPRYNPDGVSKYTYKIDPDAVFAERDVEGVRVLIDYKLVRSIQKRIAEYSNGGSPGFFSVMWTTTLSKEHFIKLETTPYFVAPRPDGSYRCLLYANDKGEIFLQDSTVHIFQMDQKHAVDLIFIDNRSCTADTLLEVMFEGISVSDSVSNSDSKDESNSHQKVEAANDSLSSITKTRTKKYAFYIMDAIRIDGHDLTQVSIDKRISFAKEKIMKPMWEASKPKKPSEQQTKFGLYIIDYLRLHEADVLLSSEFHDSLDFASRSLHFIPENLLYKCGSCPDAFLWDGTLSQLPFFFRLRIPDNPTGEENLDEGELLALQNNYLETPYAKIALTEAMRQWNGRIIHCTYKEGKWICYAVRSRCYPNSHRTIQSKLQAAKHPVTLQDLRNLFRKHARQAPTFKGFTEIDYVDPNATFFEGENVKGIRLLTDSQEVRNARSKLEECAYGSSDFFSPMEPVEMSKSDLLYITKRPHWVTVQLEGHRVILYANSDGEVFFESVKSRQLFKMEDEHALKFITEGGQMVKETVLEGVIVRLKYNSTTSNEDNKANIPATEKLTFLVTDGTKCDGEDLTEMDLYGRLEVIKDKLLLPRRKALKENPKWREMEAIYISFIGIQVIRPFHKAESYLDEEFCDKCFNGLPMSSLIFHPINTEYVHGTNWGLLRWRKNGTLTLALRLKVPKESSEKEGELYAREDINTEIPYGKIHLTDDIRHMNNCIIDCVFEGDQLKYAGPRRDLKYPNHIDVVKNNVEASNSPVSRSDLLDAIEKSRIFRDNLKSSD